MTRSLSADLRGRVISAIEEGLSTRKAAGRFRIGIATAGRWYRRYKETGETVAARLSPSTTTAAWRSSTGRSSPFPPSGACASHQATSCRMPRDQTTIASDPAADHCNGPIDRKDFERDVRSRGGFTPGLCER